MKFFIVIKNGIVPIVIFALSEHIQADLENYQMLCYQVIHNMFILERTSIYKSVIFNQNQIEKKR